MFILVFVVFAIGCSLINLKTPTMQDDYDEYLNALRARGSKELRDRREFYKQCLVDEENPAIRHFLRSDIADLEEVLQDMA